MILRLLLLVLLAVLELPRLSFAWSLNSLVGTVKDKVDSNLALLQQQQQQQQTTTTPYANSQDADYPWYFKGRAVMRPALIRWDPAVVPHESCQALSLFGWTVGGTVALEYDESPVGPYREYVCLGGLALTKNSGRLMIGQYGSRLCVSQPAAETLCQRVWNLSAETANIELQEAGDIISLSVDPSNNDLKVTGWNNLRQGEEEEEATNSLLAFEGLPLLWTPFIKAIWTSILPALSSQEEDELPLHRLRLSGTPRLSFNGFDGSSSKAFSLGLDIVLQNALIEISEEME